LGAGTRESQRLSVGAIGTFSMVGTWDFGPTHRGCYGLMARNGMELLWASFLGGAVVGSEV
jgi:hypothetical protein